MITTMTVKEVYEEIKRLRKLMCEYDQIPVDARFAVFSDDNPYQQEYDKMLIKYMTMRRLNMI